MDPQPTLVAPPQLVWLITGTSSGFGMRLTRILLARGDFIIATSRSLAKLCEVFRDLETTPHKNLALLQLNVTAGMQVIKPIIDKALQIWGRIDVLVNNAGNAYLGLIEECGSAMARSQYSSNVFGVMDVTSAVLPFMRAARSGTIVNIGSRSVWRSEAVGLGFYAASKAALHALTMTLKSEVASFNIRVLLVSPGANRTEGIFSIPVNTQNPIPDYDELRHTMVKGFAAVPGNEPGDPNKAMEILADVVRGEGVAVGRNWPEVLILGSDSERDLLVRWGKYQSVMEEWGDVARDGWY